MHKELVSLDQKNYDEYGKDPYNEKLNDTNLKCMC